MGANKLMKEYSNDFEAFFPSELIQYPELLKTVSGEELTVA